jgi:hypothetical protein
MRLLVRGEPPWQDTSLHRRRERADRALPTRSSGRLTISAARTDVALLIRRAVRPSGIPASCDL